MTLDQLRIFLEVAAREHVTRAAEALNLTQSAVSAAISALEARHAVILFNRVGRRIELTEAGKLFVPEARAVLERSQTAEHVLADLGGSASGILRIHASQTVASYWLPARLVSYHERFPRVDLRLTVGNTQSAAEAVLTGAAELAVVEGEVFLAGLKRRKVAEDRLVLVVGSRHPWADGRKIRSSDLLETNWIMRELGSGTRSAFEAQLINLGIEPQSLSVVLEMPSNEAAMAAVEAGLSATVLSSRAASSHSFSGRLHIADFPMPLRQFSAIFHGERHVTRALRAMLDLLNEPAEDSSR
ncbi:LysR substrate-binding domain-containing protein [Neorhizobium galegae]|uniref:LysR substrate-binding domain-containing protein n=1 Tax=Neorhizobium galegae TaxID=399 RepID=UPI000621DEE8|nr:LysR substrate-binding domain-containing protein [Neorhizobium galegae]CDZ57606.1 Bacterial regulatory helix-turn-helix, lysR family protein [Neorhizobium galegae bv. orientalis]KAB1124414.1 LysR family transcriptional regulator [Neorhizobium galegae]MCQ1571325.1 LysR substrate-binding domain-containing protein [Neorhizobium galegae]MCQ1804752.1 LysR substrate-binding domain-containing protein [Neorhizobium galegae]CDZ63177.1 Bacterial regulatory helix-turn-helix, lysR family protein [Neorh